jgi:hypothetical protein
METPQEFRTRTSTSTRSLIRRRDANLVTNGSSNWRSAPRRYQKVLVLSLISAVLVIPACVLAQQACTAVTKDDPRWQELDGQYARIERATIANDAKQLFAVYAPDFEAHMLNGEVWSFKQSAAYSTAGFDQVKENLSISNTFLNLVSCASNTLKVTVLQQWSRRQMVDNKLRLFQTATVQDEIWVLMNGEWKRKLVDNIRPGAWLVDLKRVDPAKHDIDASVFDPHGLFKSTDRP